MNKPLKNLSLLFTLIILITLTFPSVSAQTYNWNGYTTGQTLTNNSYTYVTGNMSATVSKPLPNTMPCTQYYGSSVASLFFCNTGPNAGYCPKYITADGGNYNLTGLLLAVDWPTKTNQVIVDISFAVPVCAPVSFSIFDINTDGGSYPFSDVVIVSGTNSLGTTVYPTATGVVPNNSYNAGTGTIASTTPTSSGGNTLSSVTFTFAAGMMSTIRIVYTSNATITNTGAGCVNNNNGTDPYYEYIIISSITTTTASVTATSPPAICEGASASLSASGASTYVWDPGSISGNPIIVNPSSTTVYTVTGTTAGGCTASATATVNVTPAFTTSVSAAPTAICNGQSTTLTASGASSYSWSPGGLSGASVSVSPSATTTYTVTGNTSGCTSSNTVTVTVNPSPSLAVSAVPQNICNGQSTSLTATGATSYTWNPGGLSGNSIVVNPSSTSTYTVVGDSLGCTSQSTITVNVQNYYNASINPVGPFCTSSSAVTLTASDPGGTWSGTGITNGGLGTFDPSVAGAGTHTITYQIAGNCGDTATTTITVNNSADATIDPAGPFCTSDAAVTLTAADGGGTWAGTGITNASLGTFDPATAGNGTHLITYMIGGSCGDTASLSITVSNALDATITPVGPYCATDAAVTLSAVDAGGTWSGTGITNAGNGTFDPSVAGAGSHLITYMLGGSCGDTATTSIVVSSAMDATIDPAGPFCNTASAVTLTAADGGGTWSGTGITNAGLGTFDPTVAGVGTHIITYMIGGSCGDTASTSITVTTSMDASIDPAGPFCSSDNAVTLTAEDPGGSWSGTGITNATLGTFDPSTAGPGTHVITYAISGSCGDTANISISVNAQANATINPSGPYCSNGSDVSLVSADPLGLWSGLGITDSISGVFDPQVAGAGSHQIIYTIGGNCGDADTINILVNPAPGLSASATPESCAGAYDGTAGVTIAGGTSPYSFAWNTSDLDSLISGLAPGTYSVTVSDANNCFGTASVTVGASDTPCEVPNIVIYLPNIFTPNGDGENDVLFVRGEGIASLDLHIYDRWGECVFETTDQATGWDGTYHGKRLDPAVYVYYLHAVFVDESEVKWKGNITVTF
jgi:gliding motility-associated-like protein